MSDSMIRVCHVSDLRAAKIISDYLHVNQIKNQIITEQVYVNSDEPQNSEYSSEYNSEYSSEYSSEEKKIIQSAKDTGTSTDVFVIMIEQVADLTKTKGLLLEFDKNPLDEKYMAAAWQRNQLDDFETQHSSHYKLGIVRFWQSTGWFTQLSTLVVLGVFLLQLLGLQFWLFQHLSFPASINHFSVTEVYRLITPALLHGDWLHLILNLSLWLWLIGQLTRQRSLRFILGLALFSAVVSHTLQAWLVNSHFVGLSGVIAGVFAYVWLAAKLKKLPYPYFPDVAFYFTVVVFLIGFIEVLGLRMANWAHLGGLAAGLIWAWFEPALMTKYSR